MNTYLTTKNLQQCCGCLSCVYSCPTNAISVENRFDGFHYPIVDYDKCINCNKCQKVCPIDNTQKNEPQKSYALKHKSDEIRIHSSSGGAFTAISDALLDNGFTIYGACFDENFVVKHHSANDKQARDSMCGSKYVQSSLENIYPEIKSKLERGEKVMFSGSPCQVAGLRSFLVVDYDNLFTMDFICHGVLSPRIFKDYLDIVTDSKQITNVSFRDKQNHSWSNSEIVTIKSNAPTNESFLGAYMRMYTRGIGMRECCPVCHFATHNRSSDFTVGDFWSIDYIMPTLNDEKGISLLMVNSQKAVSLLNEIEQSCFLSEIDINFVYKTIPHLNHGAVPSLINKEFWKYYQKNSPLKTLEIFGGNNLKSKIYRKSRELINSFLANPKGDK